MTNHTKKTEEATRPPTEEVPAMHDVLGGVIDRTPSERRIGDRIREARQRPDYDLSVEALSRLCKDSDIEGQGITPTTLLRYEQGKVLPGAREIRVLCGALDVSADWLLFGVDSKGAFTLSEGLALLAKLVEERGYTENPFRRPNEIAAFAKAEQIRRAKVPQKR